MNRKRLGVLILVLLIALSVIAGCASRWEAVDENISMSEPEYQGQVNKDAGYDTVQEDAERGEGEPTTRILVSGEDTDRKLIYTVSMSIETYTYEADYADLLADVDSIGGYIYSEYTYGTKPEEYGDAGRETILTVKIPIEQLEDFLIALEENDKVVSKNMDVQDTTDYYYDTETRINLLETQYRKLQGYLEEAETIEDMLYIESEMSDILYELDTLNGEIRNLDNRISYSSVTIYLSELVSYTKVSATSGDLGERIVEAFNASIKGLGVFFEGFVVVLIGAFPVLCVMGVIAFVVVLIVKSASKAKRKKAQAEKAKELRKE